MSLSNEQRAHDIACAIISNKIVLESYLRKFDMLELEEISVTEFYAKTYESLLERLNNEL